MVFTDMIFLFNVLLPVVAICALIVITRLASYGIKALKVYIAKNQ